jgi:hypothetical protein
MYAALYLVAFREAEKGRSVKCCKKKYCPPEIISPAGSRVLASDILFLFSQLLQCFLQPVRYGKSHPRGIFHNGKTLVGQIEQDGGGP